MYYNNQKLYKVSASTGKTQIWFATALDGDVISSYGQLDGKLQTDKYTAEPKNIGRSNETTSQEQGEIELQAMYKDKVVNGHYFESEIEAHEAAKVCRIPRKITNYKDRYDKMSETLLSSVKKDGSRACVIDGELFSKIGRKEDIKVEHLRKAVEELHKQGLATFDSEVYAEGLSLQRIRSAWLKPIKTDKEIIKVAKDLAKKVGNKDKFLTKEDAIQFLGYNPNEDAPKLKFYIFDIPDDTGKMYIQRVEVLDELLSVISTIPSVRGSFEGLTPVPTYSHENRMAFLVEVVRKGSEGLVHYEPHGVYEFGKRSTNTAKSKPRYDAEAKVLSVSRDKGGDGVLHCQCGDSLDNVKFKCKMKVERRDGKRYERDFESMQDLIDKWITFSYEDLSGAGIPTKPVGEEERLCDSKGQPLE